MVLNEQARLAAEEARPAAVELAEPQAPSSHTDRDSSLRYL